MFFFLRLELERQYREETRRIEEQRWVKIGKISMLNLVHQVWHGSLQM